MAIFTKDVVFEAAAILDQHPRNVASVLYRDLRDGIEKNFKEILPIHDLIVDFAELAPEEQEAESKEVFAALDQKPDETSGDWRMRTTTEFNDWRLEKGYWNQAQYDEWAQAVKDNIARSERH